MEYIRSKDLCLLIRDVFKLIDRRPMDHGSRTAYIFYKMLESRGGYEKFELADFVVLATLHDIGAYKTDDLGDMLQYEARDSLPHSIYGFLFMKHFSPLEEQSKILLYHHTNFDKLTNLEYKYKEEADLLNLAEKVDIYQHIMGSQFDPTMFDKYAGTKFSKESLEILARVMKEQNIFEKIHTDAYQKELDELMEFVLFSDDEKNKYLEMLMYCMGFKREDFVLDTVTTTCICRELGKHLQITKEEDDLLHYGGLFHDIGMLTIPQNLIEKSGNLKPEELERIHRHIEIAEKILRNRLHKDVVDIAVTHHERSDGSGYPKKLKENQMNRLEGILQLADTVATLTSEKNYHEAKSKEKVISFLQDESRGRKYNKEVTNAFVTHYDDIMNAVKKEAEEILATHKKLNDQYELVHKKLSGM